MSSIVDPICGIPEYELDTVDDAMHCGRYTGIVIASILTILIIIIVVSRYGKDKGGYTVILLGILAIGIVWLLPLILSFLARRRYQIYQIQIQDLVQKFGMTKADAIRQIQSIYQYQNNQSPYNGFLFGSKNPVSPSN